MWRTAFVDQVRQLLDVSLPPHAITSLGATDVEFAPLESSDGTLDHPSGFEQENLNRRSNVRRFDRLDACAVGGGRKRFERAMACVPSVEPEAYEPIRSEADDETDETRIDMDGEGRAPAA